MCQKKMTGDRRLRAEGSHTQDTRQPESLFSILLLELSNLAISVIFTRLAGVTSICIYT